MGIRLLAVFIACLGLAGVQTASATTATLEVTVSFRERIALAPDAQLDVQLFDPARADPGTRRLSAQRFVMRNVPETVVLTYDPRIIDPERDYAISAVIWSGDRPIFRGTVAQDLTGAEGSGPVSLTLAMVSGERDTQGPKGQLAGVHWVATEIGGRAWQGDEPPTLDFDEEMNFSLFAGCNRVAGTATVSGTALRFPPNAANTMMACPPEVEARERAVLEALRSVSGYVRYGAGLVLTDPEGAAAFHFRAAQE